MSTSTTPLPSTTGPTSPPPSMTTTTTATTSGSNNPNNAFEYPREYYFPPFFTRQPNQSTRYAQQQKWASLILSYCAHHRITKLSFLSTSNSTSTTSSSTPSSNHANQIFSNPQIRRQLPPSDRREILDVMRREGRVEFVNQSNNNNIDRLMGIDDYDDRAGAGSSGGGGDVVWVWWKTPEEWAALVEAYVDDTAQKGTVLTLYELVEGEDTKSCEFHGLDIELLQKALQVLVKRGKAQIFGQDDQLGVKFF